MTEQLPPAGCPIGWQPSGLTPVFWGMRNYDAAQGAPSVVRAFFPSLDGSVSGAAILEGCGRYPVIVFAHGDCRGSNGQRDPNHYRRWLYLPAQLARAGYVVLVPELPAISTHPVVENHPARRTLADLLQWIRSDWEHRGVLMPPPATGLAGHSFGALHAGILATSAPVSAVAYLSGAWMDWPPSIPSPIGRLTVPQLFTWGTDPLERIHAQLPDNVWGPIARPKHRAVFAKGEHWDYLYTESLPCVTSRGPCRHVGAATRDLLTMFFAKYLPPELWPNLPGRVPDDLVPPPLSLTREQEFYAGGYLGGLEALIGDSSCSVALHRELLTDRTVPHVLFIPQALAAKEVRDAGLVPKFSGATGRGVRWVASQSPQPGAIVPVNSEVSMYTQAGPIP